ncbi:MAG: hypothetical protein Kow0058_14320 [Roseovarius sp.]
MQRIYAGALEPSAYGEVFAAWDAYFDLIAADPEAGAETDFDWAQEFIAHFEQAGRVLDRVAPERRRSLLRQVETMTAAAALCETDGRIAHLNAAMRDLVPAVLPDRVTELPFDAPSQQALREICRPGTDWERTVLVLYGRDDQPLHLLAESLTDLDGQRRILLRLVSTLWHERLETLLAAAFSLTRAEIALLGDLFRGKSIAQIAAERGRRQVTLRTQLNSILRKTGTRSQAQLSRVVAGLAHLTDARKTADVAPHAPAALGPREQWRQTVHTAGGISVELVFSGAPGGRPVYLIQPTTCPTLTPQIVRAAADRGVLVISPMRPGTGGTTATAPQFGPADWARIHLEVLDRLGVAELAMAGHCSGGIHALELAAAAGERCRAVLLIDTGAPLSGLTMFYRMPAAPRRLFLAARCFPGAIETPIRMVAADFLASPEGEARGVDYFFEGSPADQAVLQLRDNWRITRDNMAYCFANVPQLIADIRLWSRDHAALFRRVAAGRALRFLHGQENLVHRAEAVEQFCARTLGASCRIVENAAQLLIYEHPTILAEELATL